MKVKVTLEVDLGNAATAEAPPEQEVAEIMRSEARRLGQASLPYTHNVQDWNGNTIGFCDVEEVSEVDVDRQVEAWT